MDRCENLILGVGIWKRWGGDALRMSSSVALGMGKIGTNLSILRVRGKSFFCFQKVILVATCRKMKISSNFFDGVSRWL